MPNNNLVSIIIPTYNRAHLIGETLDSVLKQTYQNWECIVVDDGSTDHTETVLKTYVEKDKRFKYFHRPKDTHLPGGNGARNYGFEVSQGDFIQWFDSDDLMVPQKIEKKVDAILNHDVDFVISKSKYFNKDKSNPYSYDYNEKDVNFLSYSTTYISWITNDLFLRRSITEKVKFNETIKAGQEYNFSCRMLFQTQKVKKVDEFLSLRRFHLDSIGKKRRLDRKHYFATTFHLHWTTLMELKENYNLPKHYVKYALIKCSKAYLMNPEIKIPIHFHVMLIKTFRLRTLYLYLAKASKRLFGKHNYFFKKFKTNR